eukprot:m.42076 g.42076  ORF g.42076 m.42076 type:complete len:77 (+) comp8277_c0_seq1:789-1019(+)
MDGAPCSHKKTTLKTFFMLLSTQRNAKSLCGITRGAVDLTVTHTAVCDSVTYSTSHEKQPQHHLYSLEVLILIRTN